MMSHDRAQEIAEKNLEVFTHEDGERLHAENEKLQKKLEALQLENASQKRVIKKLQSDLESQEELIHKMNEGHSAKILTKREIDKLLDVVDDDTHIEEQKESIISFERLFCIVEKMSEIIKTQNSRIDHLERFIKLRVANSFTPYMESNK